MSLVFTRTHIPLLIQIKTKPIKQKTCWIGLFYNLGSIEPWNNAQDKTETFTWTVIFVAAHHLAAINITCTSRNFQCWSCETTKWYCHQSNWMTAPSPPLSFHPFLSILLETMTLSYSTMKFVYIILENLQDMTMRFKYIISLMHLNMLGQYTWLPLSTVSALLNSIIGWQF